MAYIRTDMADPSKGMFRIAPPLELKKVDTIFRHKVSLEKAQATISAVPTASLQATHVLRRNQFDPKTVESTYGLQYRRQCWTTELSVSDRADDRTVMVVFSLSGLGKRGDWLTVPTSNFDPDDFLYRFSLDKG